MTYTTIDTNSVTGETTIREWTEEEVAARKERLAPLAWDNLRSDRNRRLSESDAYVTNDRWEAYTEAVRQSWRDYRQSLRDLPANTTDPFNPVWPVKPT